MEKCITQQSEFEGLINLEKEDFNNYSLIKQIIIESLQIDVSTDDIIIINISRVA